MPNERAPTTGHDTASSRAWRACITTVLPIHQATLSLLLYMENISGFKAPRPECSRRSCRSRNTPSSPSPHPARRQRSSKRTSPPPRPSRRPPCWPWTFPSRCRGSRARWWQEDELQAPSLLSHPSLTRGQRRPAESERGV